MAWKLRDIFDGGLNALTKVTEEILTADPSNLLGRFWFRSDLSRRSYYDGTAVRRVANTADPLSTFAAPSADIPMAGFGFTGVRDAVAPQEFTSLAQVQALFNGFDPRDAADYAAAAALPAYAYNNGAAGVGATITASANGVWTIDGKSLTVGDRVLLPDSVAAAPSDAGLYAVTTVGTVSVKTVLTRTTDFDNAATIVKGAYFFVMTGTTLAGSGWVMTQRSAITVGTTAITFTRVTANGSSVKTFAADIGDGTTNPLVVSHGLGSKDFVAGVIENSTGDKVDCGINQDATHVTITFSVVATAAQYRVTCVG